MASKKVWIILGALFAALLGASPVSAGAAIDNAVMLDPYDPVPPIQFSHWYAGGCARECGGCEHSCRQPTGCGEDCYRERCDHDCGRNACDHDCGRDRCDHNCYRDACDRDCAGGNCDGGCGHDGCEHDCYRESCDHDCGRDCKGDDCHLEQKAELPCTSGDCYESETWEHRWLDGTRAKVEYMDRGRSEGNLRDYQPRRRHHHDRDDDDDRDDGR